MAQPYYMLFIRFTAILGRVFGVGNDFILLTNKSLLKAILRAIKKPIKV
jgi:hypothetical protein